MPSGRRESSPPLSSSPRSGSSSSQSEPADLVRLKRALEEKQRKIDELETGQKKPKRKWTYVSLILWCFGSLLISCSARTGGRGIRRIISMYDTVSFIMDQATDNLIEEEEGENQELELTKTEEELAIIKSK